METTPSLCRLIQNIFLPIFSCGSHEPEQRWTPEREKGGCDSAHDSTDLIEEGKGHCEEDTHARDRQAYADLSR